MPSLAKQQNSKLTQLVSIQSGQPKPRKLANTYDGLRKIIDKLDCNMIKEVIDATPQLLIKCKLNENPLKYAAITGKTQAVCTLLQIGYSKYKNLITEGSNFINDPFVECIRFQRFDMVKLFVEAGFNLNSIVFKSKRLIMKSIDFAIVGGHYQIAYFIYGKLNPEMRLIRDIKQFEMIGKKYLYRYVNYNMIIQGLIQNVHPDNIGNYLKKELTPERKIKIKRMWEQGCWEWFMRMLGFDSSKKDQDKLAKTSVSTADTKYLKQSSVQTAQSSHKHLQHTMSPLDQHNQPENQQQ